MELYFNQYFFPGIDGNFDHEQEHSENSFSASADYLHAFGDPNTINPNTINPFDCLLVPTIPPSLRLAPNTDSYDPASLDTVDFFSRSDIMSMGQDVAGQAPFLTTQYSELRESVSVPRPRPSTGTMRSLKQATTFDLQTVPREVTSHATRQLPSTLSVATSNGLFEDPFRPEVFRKQHLQKSRPLAKTSVLSAKSSSEQSRPYASEIANVETLTQPAIRPSPRSLSLSARNQDAQSDFSRGHPDSAGVFDDILSSGSEQCSIVTPPTPKCEQHLRKSVLRAKEQDVLSSSARGRRRKVGDRLSQRFNCHKTAGKRDASAHSNVDSISGWGWRARGVNDAWPAFGDTQELCPIFDEQGQHVRTTLHGTFHFSRGQKGQVSDDCGELVHELQKRNIFHIKDIHYTLALSDATFTYLTVEHEDRLKRVHNLSLRLIGRDFDGELKRSHETPLETRGKAREFASAREWNETILMRPRETDGFFTKVRFMGTGVDSLPDTFSAMHLEFSHATPGNKTMGVWRLPTQHYYRLVIQLCASLHGTEGVVVIAERSTELLLVRGRPPGGREQARLKAFDNCVKQGEEPTVKGSDRRPMKKQKRGSQTKREVGQGNWAGDLNGHPLTETRPVQNRGWSASQSSLMDIQGERASRRYDTRNARKPTYRESDAEDARSGDDDGEYEVEDGGLSSYEGRPLKEHSEDLNSDVEDGSDDCSSREDWIRSQYDVNNADHQESDAADWCSMDDRAKNESRQYQASQIQQADSSFCEDDSDFGDDSVVDDPMGLEEAINFALKDQPLEQPSQAHRLSYLGDIDHNSVQQRHISSDHSEEVEEPPQAPKDHLQQRLKSRILGSEVPPNTILPLSSAPYSGSSHSTSYFLGYEQQDARHNPMTSKIFPHTLAPQDAVLRKDLIASTTFQDYQGSDW